MALQNGQVTLGSGATALIASGEILAKWLIIQNNAAHSVRIGSATGVGASKGIYLAAGPGGGSMNPPPAAPLSSTRLSSVYLYGTQNDVIDYAYEDGL